MATINDLPNELLILIVGAATAVPHSYWPYNKPHHEHPAMAKALAYIPHSSQHTIDAVRASVYRNECYITAAALARVNRRFHRLAMPHLYAELHVSCAKVHSLSSPNPDKTWRLHRSCKHNPALGLLCRRLALYFDDDFPERFDLAWNFVTWCKAAHTLEINGLRKRNGVGASLAFLVYHMPRLEQLIFRPLFGGIVDDNLQFDAGYRGGIELTMVMNAVSQLSKLHTLEVVGAGWMEDGLKEKPASAPFTEVRLSDFLEDWDTLGDLMRWPACLEVFDLSRSWGLDDTEFDIPDDYPIGGAMTKLHQLLFPHRKTLRVLRIRGLANSESDSFDNQTSFDLRSFEALTHLTLCHGDTGTNPRFIHHLLAPHLRFLCWDLFTNEFCNGMDGLAQPEEDWLRALAYKATEGPGGKELRQVKVLFTSAAWCYRNNDVYPWDRLERLAGEMQQVGIELRWDRPSVSRKEFEELKKMRGFNARGV